MKTLHQYVLAMSFIAGSLLLSRCSSLETFSSLNIKLTVLSLQGQDSPTLKCCYHRFKWVCLFLVITHSDANTDRKCRNADSNTYPSSETPMSRRQLKNYFLVEFYSSIGITSASRREGQQGVILQLAFGHFGINLLVSALGVIVFMKIQPYPFSIGNLPF